MPATPLHRGLSLTNCTVKIDDVASKVYPNNPDDAEKGNSRNAVRDITLAIPPRVDRVSDASVPRIDLITKNGCPSQPADQLQPQPRPDPAAAGEEQEQAEHADSI